MLYLIIRDEARHVTFGVNYLEEFVKTLSDEEREERAQFAYEACVVMRGRLMSSEVYEHFGWDVEDASSTSHPKCSYTSEDINLPLITTQAS